MPENDRPGTRSNPQINPADYQLLYEFERRLDEKFKDFRQQSRDDTAAAVAPIFVRLDSIDQRLDEGNKKFAAQDDRADDHSDRIKSTERQLIVRPSKTEALERRRMPWWLPLLVGGGLAFVGERAARAVINSLADTAPAPVPVITPQTNPPTIPRS